MYSFEQVKKNVKVSSVDVPMVVTFLCVAGKALMTSLFMNMKITQGAIWTTAGLLLMLFSFCSFLSVRHRKQFLLSANLAISFLLFLDALYFSYFHEPWSTYAFLQVGNAAGLVGSIVYLLEFKYLIFIADLPLIVYLFFSTEQQSNPLNKKFFIRFFAVACLLLLFKPVKKILLDDHVNVFRRMDSLTYVHDYGVLGNRFLDAFIFFTDRTIKLETADIAEIEAWFSAKEKKQLTPSPYRSLSEGRNLVLIQFESLQTFVLKKTADGQEITPNLNRLLENSFSFENIYPQTIEGNSSDAELIANTSLFPLKRGSTFFRYPGVKYNSLGYILKQRGYRTIAVHADEGTYWNRCRVFPNLGFDRFVELKNFEQDDFIGMGLSDLSMFKQSVPLLKTMKQPFFAFYITLTSHMPFQIPDKEKRLTFSKELSDSYLGNYFQSINYADRALGFFLRELGEAGLLGNTLIVIYGDHAGLMEKDRPLVERLWSSRSITDDEWTRTYNTVPLIIFNPSFHGQTLEKIGGHIDILPTIAHLMGFDTQEKYMLGSNLFTDNEGWALVPKGDYKRKELIITKNGEHDIPNDRRKQMLDISELMIRGDFFNESSRKKRSLE